MAKEDLLPMIRGRNRESSKKVKDRVLDEFVAGTGHRRKRRIRLLTESKVEAEELSGPVGRSGEHADSEFLGAAVYADRAGGGTAVVQGDRLDIIRTRLGLALQAVDFRRFGRGGHVGMLLLDNDASVTDGLGCSACASSP